MYTICMCMHIYIYIYTQVPNHVDIESIESRPNMFESLGNVNRQSGRILHSRHILPPSEIDLGLFWAVFTGSEGKYLFHRIG